MWLANRLFPSVRRLQARLAGLEAEVDEILTPDELRRWTDEIAACYRYTVDFWFSIYEPGAGEVIFDVGAGHGEDVLPFAQKIGPAGKIIAIEAHPVAYGQLSRLCRLKRLKNVVTLNVAAWDAPSHVVIDDREKWDANTVRRSGTGIPVRAITLDAICKEQRIDHIDFLKMNIEGSEAPALLGASETLGKTQTICVCCHDFRADNGHGEEYRTRDVVTEGLTKSGFRVWRRTTDPRAVVRDHVWGTRRK
jgi:FkbM family methyltransferase